MPFKIIHDGKHWRIYKINTQVFAKPKFKTKNAAVNQAKNWIRYAKKYENPHVIS